MYVDCMMDCILIAGGNGAEITIRSCKNTMLLGFLIAILGIAFVECILLLADVLELNYFQLQNELTSGGCSL